MIAPRPKRSAAPDRLTSLEAEVRGLRAEVRDLLTIMDAMREAWLLPPVEELRLEQAKAAAANRVSAAGIVSPPRSKALRLDGAAALEAARREGVDVARRGGTVTHCPFGEGEPELRTAWLEGLQRADAPKGWNAGNVRR